MAIWLTAAVLYALFYLWYVGFPRKLTQPEIEALLEYMADEYPPERLREIRRFLEADDGKDFVMVNLLELRKDPEAAKQMATYSRPFLRDLLRKAGHPVFRGRPVSGAVDFWGIEAPADDWTIVALVRYRSRRDMMDFVYAQPKGFHEAKIAAVGRTIGIPTPHWFMLGGPKWIVPLALVAIAALLT